MSKYIGCWFGLKEAAEENGEMRIAHAFEAINDKQAKAKAALLFMEAFPDADDSQFEFRLYVAADGIPCPAEEWDEAFLFDHEWDDDKGHPIANVQASPVDFNGLQPSVRIAVLVKYNTTEITRDQLSAAIELQQGNSSTFDSHIVEAISKTLPIPSMYPERILEAINYVRENCAPDKKWPEIKAALSVWLDNHEKDRQDGNENPVVETVTPRPYQHNYKTLDIEIATALWPGDVDPNNPDPAITRRATEIIKEDREDFKRWSIQLRTQPDILKYDRPTIFGVVRNVPAEDTYHFPDSHARYITGYLKDYGKMENADNETEQNAAAATGTVETVPPVENVENSGPFYFLMADGEKVGRANKLNGLKKALADGGTEISQEEYQARKNGTYKAPQEVTAQPAGQTEVKKIADGVFSIDNLMGNQQLVHSSNEAEKTELAVVSPSTTTFQSIGAALEHDLAEKGDNMKIWRSVMRTDPRYTKDLAGVGFEGTSINAEYMIMRATEIFGPIGTGWGFEVMEDRMLPGAPMSEAIYEDKKFIGNRLLRDADGTLITEKNHSIKIKLWYAIEGEVRGEVEAYGATKYLYKTKHGITCDGEAQKKSLTDAIKKALSLLGFSADVWLGMYDLAEYKQENAIEFDIRNASDKAEDITRIRKELDEKFKLNTDSMRSAVTPNEISGIASSLTRVMGVHLKAAREKADHEYTKYLEGRLRRLEEVKSECLTKLQEKTA
ncbi:exodeoxyribonuclease VIII [Enterobacteriaceae bacterium ESL0689]|nr:exodeoxyribonuclease VIII [Enterobacteriaceae bacterium ESL0689]